MENKDISQIALQRIKESGIKPISKNIFNLKRVIFWTLILLSLIVGIMSFSVMSSLLFNNDWDLYHKFGFNFIFKTIPYFWFVCLLILTILGEFYYRKTLLGYRHKVITIIGIYIIITIIFGSILHLFRIGEKIEQSLTDNIPVYRGVVFDKNKFWSDPEKGLISGKIVSIEDSSIKIVDFNNNIWTLDIDDTSISKRVIIKNGEIIRITGRKDNGNVFIAEQIRPWVGARFNGSKENKVR